MGSLKFKIYDLSRSIEIGEMILQICDLTFIDCKRIDLYTKK